MNISLLLNPMERDWFKNTETHTSRTKFNDEEWEVMIKKREAKSYAKAEERRVAREDKLAKAAATVHQQVVPCNHTGSKYQCEKCTPRCVHLKAFGNCKLCPDWGSRFCVHGKFKHHCIMCFPKRFCPHGKRQHRCRICPSFREEFSQRVCPGCYDKTVSKTGALCAACRKSTEKRT